MKKHSSPQSDQFLKWLKEETLLSLSTEKKACLKQKIMQQVCNEKKETHAFVSYIKNIYATITAPQQLKERILSELYSRKQKIQPFRSFIQLIQNHKKVSASLTLGIFSISIVISVSFNPTSTYASRKIILEITQGQVNIQRKGEILTTQETAILQKGDLVTTMPDSQAVIYFPDESVSRLASQTKLKINEVLLNPENPAESNIEIAITQGRVWNNVVNLVENKGEFTVKTPTTTASTKKNATFDIKVQEESVQVNSIKNDVEIKKNQNTEKTQVTEGYTAEISHNLPITVENSTHQEAWIAENKSNDEKYLELLQQKKTEQIKQNALANNPIKKVQHDLISSVTSPNTTKKELADAENIYNNAQLLLSEGKETEAKILLDEYKSKLKKITEESKELPEKEMNSVLKIVKNTLDAKEKDLLVFPSNSPLKKAENTVQEIREETGNTPFIDLSDAKTNQEIFEEIKKSQPLTQSAATPDVSTHTKTNTPLLDLFLEEN